MVYNVLSISVLGTRYLLPFLYQAITGRENKKAVFMVGSEIDVPRGTVDLKT